MRFVLGFLAFLAIMYGGNALFGIHPTLGEGLLVIAAVGVSNAVEKMLS